MDTQTMLEKAHENISEALKLPKEAGYSALNLGWRLIESAMLTSSYRELKMDLDKEVMDPLRYGNRDTVSIALIKLKAIINRMMNGYYQTAWRPSGIGFGDYEGSN